MTRWADGYIAVDWGTTNRRAYRIGADGATVGEFEDDKGIMSVAAGEFAGAVDEIRVRLGDAPLLMAGMIGSNRGWIEAPYVACPAGAKELAHELAWAEPGRTAIVPGLCYSAGDAADVMRGEEVQIIGGLAAGLIPADCLLCHPGTHNKWVQVEGGRIASFQTVMTGELFSLLKKGSILADILTWPVVTGGAFEAGVERGLSCDELTADLFSIRARVLLGKARREDAASFTSGLLIGTDIRGALRATDREEIIVMARPELSQLFAAALGVAGRRAVEIDGESAFLAGIARIAEMLQ